MKARTLLLVCLTAAAATGCLGLGADRAAPPLPPGALLENPLFLPQGQESYQQVFHDVYRAVDAYFPVASSNVYAGSIESSPVTTAGFWDSLRYGWWDTYEIAESSAQTIRRRAVIRIMPAEVGGYFVDVRVFKELEDLPQPVHAYAGGAVIRHELPLDATMGTAPVAGDCPGWIPIGRDEALEQRILRRLRCLP